MKPQSKARTINFVSLRNFIRDNSLEPLEKCIIFDLLLYAGTYNDAFPSEETLGKDLNRSSRHIRTRLKRLKDLGWVTWKKKGFSKSNIYSINEELYFRNENPIRKPVPSQIGDPVPVQSGTTLPPKVSQERNQISDRDTKQLFEKINRRSIRKQEEEQLSRLCQVYSPSSVSEAIRLAQNRGKTNINPAYLSKILEDWQLHRKAPQKPVFEPCGLNGCRDGLIFNSAKNTFLICDCRTEFDSERKEWNKNGASNKSNI